MTVTITVKIFAYIRAYDGPREITAELPEGVGEAVNQLLAGSCAELSKGFGSFYHLLVNGRSYHLALGENMILKDGDSLTFVSMVSGG